MQSSLSIGITGGIGSGKSIVCRIFKTLQIPVYDADKRARYLLNNDRQLIADVTRLFGERAYSQDGLNNQWIASQIFHREDLLKKMNSLVHPRVAIDFATWRQKQNEPSPYMIKEAALLFEAGSYKDLDKVILVTAPEELRIERITKRDKHRSVSQIKDIIARQWPEERKREMADYVITNDGKQMLLPQVLELHEKFLELSGTKS